MDGVKLQEEVVLPEFSLPLLGGGSLESQSLADRRILLYFYPRDDTPGCTIEAREFSELLDAFATKDVEVFGVSPDDEESHRRFHDKCGLSVPLATDQDHKLASALGAWGTSSIGGNSYEGVQRSTFFIDHGRVAGVWRKVKPQGHAAEVLAAIQ